MNLFPRTILIIAICTLTAVSYTPQARAEGDTLKECLDNCLAAFSTCLDIGGAICEWLYPTDDAAWENCLSMVENHCSASADQCAEDCEKQFRPRPRPGWDPVPPIGPIDPPQVCGGGYYRGC